jgi:hypothetical protein
MPGLGFKPSEADPCLFTGHVDCERMLIGLYVGDALLIGSPYRIEKLINHMQKSFEIKNSGMLKPGDTFKVLGLELRRLNNPKLGVLLTQQRYAESVYALEKFGMQGCKPVASPMAPGFKLDHEGEVLPEGNEYGQLLVVCCTWQ